LAEKAEGKRKVEFREGDTIAKMVVGGGILRAKRGTFIADGKRRDAIIIEKLDMKGEWTGQRIIMDDRPDVKEKAGRFFSVLLNSW
jgi:hypothetical protein